VVRIKELGFAVTDVIEPAPARQPRANPRQPRENPRQPPEDPRPPRAHAPQPRRPQAAAS